MPDYRLDFQEGYQLRTDPDSLSFHAPNPAAAFVRAAEAIGLEPEIAIPEGVPNWEAFRRRGAKALVCNGKAISAQYDTLYYVGSYLDDGRYHTMLGSTFVAMSNRDVVVRAIADFLNGLPPGVSAEEVLDAFSMGPRRGRSRVLARWGVAV